MGLKLKNSLSVILTVALVIAQAGFAFGYEETESKYLAIQANKYQIRCRKNVKGAMVKGSIEDYSAGLYYLINGEEAVTETFTADGTNDIISEPVYCKNAMYIDTVNFKNDSITASQESVIVNSKNIISEKMGIIYAESGDIVLNGDNIDFTGIIYAPYGKVIINADKLSVKGCVIGDNVNIKSKNLSITPNEESESLISFLRGYRNNGYMMFDAYFEEGNLNLYCDANLDMDKGIVYARYDDGSYFEKAGEIESNQGVLENIQFSSRLDIIVEGRTIFNEKIESDVISFKKDGNGEIIYDRQDSDKDGIEDGIEIFYLNTSPDNADTDNNGIGDGVEAYKSYENPVEKDKDLTLGRFDKVVTRFDSDGNCIQEIYDFINEKVKVEKKGDLLKQYYYDADMNLIRKVTEYNGECAVNNYEYDGEDLTAIYNNDYKYSFTYDDEKRLVKVALNDIILVEYEYTEDCKKIRYANGSYTSRITSDNQTIVEDSFGEDYVCTYNADNDVETFEYPDSGIVVDYSYDENGDLVSVDTNTDFNIDYDKVTDDNVRTTNVTYTIGDDEYSQTDVVEYDEQEGKKTDSLLITGDEVKQSYDGDNSLIESYMLKGKEYCNKVTFNDSAKADTITYSDGTMLSYTYNSNDFITEVKENGTVINEYAYDLLDRLICEKDIENQRITYYTYDLYDNMVHSETYEYKGKAEGALITENKYEYSDVYGDQLVRFNGTDITYDESGKPLSYYNGFQYTWNGNKLMAADNGDKKIEFIYDNNGTLIEKRVNGEATVYSVEGTDYIVESSGGKEIIYMYNSDANLLGFVYDGNAYYYYKNANDDIIKIINADNEFVCGYEYDAWGNIVEITGNEAIARLNKYRYRSYYYDEDMGMYYLHSRYYDSVTGRFISTDDVEMMVYHEDNLNLYAYCHSNPVCYYDPEGTHEKVCIMSLTEWKGESKNIGDDFKEYYHYTTCPVDYMFSDNMNKYESKWNDLSGYTIVVLNTHGCADELSNSSETATDKSRLTIAEIEKLEYKCISTVILLGCNAGHYDKIWSNVAFAFCKRISGCVVASDGTVQSGFLNSIGKAKFTSVAEDGFYRDCSTKRDNYGWVIYKYKRILKKIVSYRNLGNGNKTLTIDWIMEHVEANAYYK